MSVTVEIRDSANNLEGILEVKDSISFPLSLNYGVADIKNATPSNKRYRGGSFSRTFEVAGSQANDQLLQHIYDTNIEDSKDVKAKKDCVVKIDGAPYLRGGFKVNNIETEAGVKTYQCVVTGDNTVWVDLFNQLKLDELDWGSHTFDILTIENSWTASNLDYYYPFTNYGRWTQGDNITVEDLRPMIFFKSMIDKAFSSIGYKVESTFFNTNQFKKIGRLFTGTGFKHDEDTLAANKFKATKTSDQVVSFGAKAFNVPLFGLIDPIQFETSDNAIFNPATEKFTVDEQGKYDFEISLNIQAKQQAPDTMFFQLIKNGFILEEIEIFFSNGTSTSTPGFSSVSDLIVQTGEFDLITGDEITFGYRFEYGSITIKAIPDIEITIQIGTFAGNQLSPQFINGVIIDLAKQLPDTPIINFINGLTHEFNLYWKTNVAERKIRVEPFGDWVDLDNDTQIGFYKSIPNANNFTLDFDASKKHKVTFLSDYKRELRYRYKDDTKDVFLTKINNAENESFGSYKHTFSDRFTEGEQESINPTFAFTYYITDRSVARNSLATDAPLLGRLWGEQKVNGEPPTFDTDFEERIVYKNFAAQGGNEVKWEGNFISVIPTALSYGDRSTDLDLKFNGNLGLVKTFYGSQLSVIEKGILLNAFFNLSESNVLRLENGDLIREPLYLSDPVELKGYWLINQITDVTPQDPGTYKFELVKFENKTPLTIDEDQSGGIGDGDFGEDKIFSPGLETGGNKDDIDVFAEITLSGENTAYLHVTILNTDTNLIEPVTIPG